MRIAFRPFLAALALAVVPVWALAETVTVFAASSLGTALAGIKQGFEAASGHEVVVSLAGTSALARQIEQGAPADIFISANSDWMDLLDRGGFLEAGTRFDLLSNSLGPVDNQDSICA